MTETARCYECGGDMHPGTTTYCDTASATPLMVTNIPALVCGQCGLAAYTMGVAKEIERLATDRPTPTRTITVPVYELAKGRYQAPAGEPSPAERG